MFKDSSDKYFGLNFIQDSVKMEVYRIENKYGYQHQYRPGNVNVTYNHYGNIVFANVPQIQPSAPLGK